MSAIDANFPLSLPSILWVAEWGGSLLAIGGALVMSMNRSWSWCAWPIWIFSNLLLVAPTALSEHWGMVVMQVAFVVVNVNGLLRCSGVPPRASACLTTTGGSGDDQKA